MRSIKPLLIFSIAVALAPFGCGGGDTATNAPNANSSNANSAQTPANNALDTVKKPEAATTNDAPTIAPVVHAYYDALKKKDAAAVRKVMERGFLETTEKEMKAEGKTDIIAYLTEFDELPEGKMQVRNEQISGNRATAELKGGSYGDWVKIVFVNEGGAWKISNEIPR